MGGSEKKEGRMGREDEGKKVQGRKEINGGGGIEGRK